MAEAIDETTIVAWLDGELPEAEATWLANAIAADPALAALAQRHRRMKMRFAAAFDPIAWMPPRAPDRAPAPVISLAAVRAEKATHAAKTIPPIRRWALPGAIAASLLIGAALGHFFGQPAGVADRPGALALSSPIADALDTRLSSDAGPVRIVFSFRNRAGDYCRSFAAIHLAGVACHGNAGWQMRAAIARADRRIADPGDDAAQIVAAMMSGEPLDRAGEAAARAKGWR